MSVSTSRTSVPAMLLAGILAVAAATAPSPVAAADTQAVLTIGSASAAGTFSPLLLGGNSRWSDAYYGGWDVSAQQAYPAFVQTLTDSRISSMRFPGGTVANLYHFQRAIGPVSGRQAQVSGSDGRPLTDEVGPDEFGRLVEQTGEQGAVGVVNFSSGTPQEAAEFVSYMTGKVGATTIDGVDWAQLRANNGHPAPYDIPYWEVGNEMADGGQYYWREGASTADALNLYAFGGSNTITDEPVGTPTDYRDSADVSSGAAHQSFVVRYAPVVAGSQHLYVGGSEWSRVSDLSTASPTAQVYTLDFATGAIEFGDGSHGAIPAAGSAITISYTSGPHAGFVDFYTAMKQANPDIQVCSGYSQAAASGDAIVKFVQAMGSTHPYDCVEQHSYVTGTINTDLDVNEYHARLMQRMSNQVSGVRSVQAAIQQYAGDSASRIKIVETEYGQLGSTHPTASPQYHLGLSEGLLMSDYLNEFAEAGIPVANKSHLNDYVFTPNPYPGGNASSTPYNTMIADGPDGTFVLTPTGLVPGMYAPLAGGTMLTTSVANAPDYVLEDGSHLTSLDTVAARTGDVLHVMVVNQDPVDDVTATVDPGVAHATTVGMSTLDGPAVDSYNQPGSSPVAVTTASTSTGTGAFTYTFPAHSLTRLDITL